MTRYTYSLQSTMLLCAQSVTSDCAHCAEESGSKVEVVLQQLAAWAYHRRLCIAAAVARAAYEQATGVKSALHLRPSQSTQDSRMPQVLPAAHWLFSALLHGVQCTKCLNDELDQLMQEVAHSMAVSVSVARAAVLVANDARSAAEPLCEAAILDAAVHLANNGAGIMDTSAEVLYHTTA